MAIHETFPGEVWEINEISDTVLQSPTATTQSSLD